jgi:hypothetical protein
MKSDLNLLQIDDSSRHHIVDDHDIEANLSSDVASCVVSTPSTLRRLMLWTRPRVIASTSSWD